MLKPHLFSWVVLLLIMRVFEICATAQSSPSPSANLQSTAAPKQENPSSAATQAPPPPCPSAGLPPMQSSQPGTGHHKVILSWNASASSPNAVRSAVGYCVYRRKEKEKKKEEKKEKNAAKVKPTCGKCENVNSVPVIGTSCVDDVVVDGATYDYMVTAINAKGISSTPSNVATAVIPPEKQSRSVPVSSPPPPSCRGASNTK
jgi:hypothetical protein